MTKQMKSRRQMRGYSMIEVLVAMGIISLLSAFAAPSLVTTYRNYLLDDAASQVASTLKFARYEAVRQNQFLFCSITPVNGHSAIYVDADRSATLDPGEKRFLLTGIAALADSASVSGAGALPAVAHVAALTTVNPNNGSITFDGRGAKTTAGISVYWVGNANFGWRAVTVMPSGSVQVWSYATGSWSQLS